MNDIINFYEDHCIRYQLIHKIKKESLIYLIITVLGIILIENILNNLNKLIVFGIELLFASLMIFIFLSEYMRQMNIVINNNKKRISKIEKIKWKNIDIQTKKFFNIINCYEIKMMEEYLEDKKLMKKDKILFIINNLKEKIKKTNIIMNLQLVFIVPLAIAIGTNYLSKIDIKDAGVFIFYCLIYVAIIVIIINVITILILMIEELIRIPIRDKHTYKILEEILSEIYIKM